MNIAVIAANGRSGQAFVAQAVAAGHSIRAGVHGHHSFAPQAGLTILPCDATNAGQVRELITGQDAVVSFIGHVKGSPATVQTDATRVIIQEMQALGLRRFVSLTGTGVRFAGDRISLIDRLLNAAVSLIDPVRIRDGRMHVEVLRASSLDWTVVRILKLQDVAPRPYVLREHGPTKWYVGRQEVAQAVLEVLRDESFVHQAPIIGRP